MNIKREIKDYLLDIQKECEYLLERCQRIKFEEFLQNEDLKRAVVRSLEVIGESAKKIPQDLRNRFKEIEWKEVARMRDKLIHEYFGIDYEIVWKTLKEDIPLLKKVIDKIIKEYE